MATEKGITRYFGVNLAEILAEKISAVDQEFDQSGYIEGIRKAYQPLGYTGRIELHADLLYRYLPEDYREATEILLAILGEENQQETGMFSEFYWIMPIGKYVEKYGLEHRDRSLDVIEEITKRNTGEYAIRPFIRRDPGETLKRMKMWAVSGNFHLRRLASEGLRPKLPWATKLDTFVDNPGPVFEILELLKEDEVMFVKKSVANHLTDWLKVNREPTVELIRRWSASENKHTKWIIKRATRKFPMEGGQ